MKGLPYLFVLFNIFLFIAHGRAMSSDISMVDKNKREKGTQSKLRGTSKERKEKKSLRRLDGDDPGTELPHLFNSIVVPEDMEVYFFSESKLHIVFCGAVYMQPFKDTNEDFTRLATHIGDLPQPPGKGYIHYMAKHNVTMVSGIESISVRTLLRYNERYLRGADLKNILRVFYRTFDHLLESPRISPWCFSQEYVTDCVNGFKPVKYPHLFMGNSGGRFSHSSRPGYKGVVMELGFLEASDMPRQRFEIVVRLQNGQTYREFVEGAITEALPRELDDNVIYR